MNRVRILLADDHALVRSGIRLVLESLSGLEVVGEAQGGHEALKLVESLRPDIALLDISMPGLNGIETARHMRKRFPSIRSVILSMHDGEAYVSQALRAGASGYLLKDATPAELELALTAVSRGETYLSTRVSGVVIERFLQSTEKSASPLQHLTERQREILQLIAEGYSTKQIAGQLGVSIKTVETHRSLLMDRLDIHDVAGLVRFALRNGIVQEDH